MDAAGSELLEILETKVTANRKEYLQLASRLNNLRLAVRLPPELLVEIFKHCAGLLTNPDNGVPPSLDWIWATHVCRRWRQVALETPMLWTSFPIIHRPSYVRAFLARSGSLPLRVHGVARASMSALTKRAWKRTLEQAHRIRWLTIDIQGQERVDRPVHPFGSFEPGTPAFPSLRCLSITIDRCVMAPLPTLFHGINLHSPLEELSVSFVEFSSAQPLFLPTLKRLTISAYPNYIELASWSTFIGALAKLKMLEVLRTEALPPPLLPPLSPDDIVTDKATLPALRHLSIESAFSRLTPGTLLRHLECTPKILTLTIGQRYAAPFDGELLENSDNALPSISSSLRSTITKMTPIRTVIISLDSLWDENDTVTVHGWDFINVRRSGEDTELGDANLLVELTGYNGRTVVERLIRDMPLSDVKSLSVPIRGERMMAIEEATWASALGQMTNLDTISVNTQAVLRCIAVRPGESLLFPKLKFLQLHNIDFARKEPDGWSDVVREVLQGREAAGKRLFAVIVSNSRNFTEEVATEIRKFTGRLEWDGKTDGPLIVHRSEARSEQGSSEFTTSDHESTGEDSDMDPYV